MSTPGGHGAPSEDELDPDEPRTPMWLPLLGLCLFVGFVIYLVAGQKPEPAPAEATPAPSAAASAAQAAPPPQPAAPH